MRNTRFEVRPTSGALGAEPLGIDLSDPLDSHGASDVRQALNEHGVIFFRDQHLSPEQHVALSPGLKKTLKGLRAVHTSRYVFGVKAH